MKTIISLGREIKNFLFLFLVINSYSFFSQNDECGTPPPPLFVLNANYSHSTDPNYAVNNDVEQKVYNIYFLGINSDNGTSPTPLIEQDVLNAVANLNRSFNDNRIFFKYRGFDHINSSRFDTITFDYSVPHDNFYTKLDSLAIADDYKMDNAFNVYVPQHIEDRSGAANFYRTTLYVRDEALLKPILQHEIGHCFNLIHTFENYDAALNCERVTRLELDPYYNADDAGDLIVDTPAQDTMFGDVDSNCNYTGQGEDCGDPPTNDPPDPYQILVEDTKNFMGYGGLRLCGDRFTAGQKVRMREAIDTDAYGELGNAETTIDSLYLPYRGNYGAGGAPSGPPPVFQPGFDYVFKQCGPFGQYPPPPDWFDISHFTIINGGYYTFSKDILPQDYHTIIHYNHFAITIQQVEDTNATRCCYSVGNGFADNGNLILFNDGVFNTNVTITPQDSTQINNPNLIQELQPGLYNIQKNYNGIIEETTIIKEN